MDRRPPDVAPIVWFTGLPSSGKSTLATGVRDRLRAQGIACVVLDSDAVRKAALSNLGYSPTERDTFYAALGGLAVLIANQGVVVLVAATAPRRAHRQAVRERVSQFLEIYVDVPPAECARRDPKGLYAAALRGQRSHVPGIDTEYQPPIAPELVARGGFDDEAVVWIAERIAKEVPTGGRARQMPSP
jgi:adenylylsulfate kinase